MFRKIISNHHPDKTEDLGEDPHPGNDNQANDSASPAAPGDMDAPPRKRHWPTESISAAFERQMLQIRALLTETLNQPSESDACLRIVAECQKQAATFANHTMERHALHPAVETVDFLAGLLRQLNEQAASLAAARACCPTFQSLLDAITEAAKMAQARCEYLDMKAINPQPLDDLEPERHEIRQAIPTDDAGKHRHVERTLIPGLIYRGTVLRRAQVSIYRHVDKS